MLVSHKFRFIFVHIAKTGGTSIRSALTPILLKDPYRFVQYLLNRLSDLTSHRVGVKFPRHARIIAAMEILPRDYFDSMFKFAFVRNPWDLQVSSYHHVRRERPHLLKNVSSFEDFLKWKLEEERPYHYILDASAEPQWYSLIDIQGRCVMDFIGRFETLERDFYKVCKRIGFKPIPSLPHKRKALDRQRDYRAYYSDWAAELVAKHFKLDIENLGYNFDDVTAGQEEVS